MKKIIKGISVMLIGLSLVACGKKEAPKAENKQITYKSVKLIDAKREEIDKISISSGTLDSINEMQEVTKNRGDIIKINHKNGDKVKKGDVILVLQNQDVKSAYLECKAKLNSTLADYNTQTTSYKKYARLYKENLISEDEYLTVKNKLSASKATYESAVAMLAKEKKNYTDLTVRAKINGTIANLDLKLWGKVEAQTPLFRIVDNDHLRILSGVAAKDILGLKEGAMANLFVEGETTPVVGSLYEINPIATEGTRKFQVKIQIPNKDNKYKQGMFAKVELNTGKKQGIVVPKSAIIIEELYSYVYEVTPKSVEIENADGQKEMSPVMVAKKVRVDLGETIGKNQEIISPELGDTNKIVVVGQYSLTDGDYTKEMK